MSQRRLSEREGMRAESAPLLSDVRILGSTESAEASILNCVDQHSRDRLMGASITEATEILSVAHFNPALELILAGTELPGGRYSPDTLIRDAIASAPAAMLAAQSFVKAAPSGCALAIGLEIDEGVPKFVAWFRRYEPASDSDIQSPTLPPAPIGQPPATVAKWFTLVSNMPVPEHDGTLATARLAADIYVQSSKAANTLRSYRSAVRSWCQWTSKHELPALPARSEDVAAYLAEMGQLKRKLSTIDLHRAALRYLHYLAQVAVPTAHPQVSSTVTGIRRKAKNPIPVKKTALTWDRLTEVVDVITDTDPVALRDRAILLVGFAGAFRRSELASLEVEHIIVDDDGMQITLPRSKSDTQAKGVMIGIPRGVTRHCPVRAYERWIKAAGVKGGPIFRRVWLAPAKKQSKTPPLPRIGAHPLSTNAIASIIQKWCSVAGLQGDFAGHSLRRGAISTGAADGFDLLELKRFSRHSSLHIVEGYIDEASIKTRNPGRSRF